MSDHTAENDAPAPEYHEGVVFGIRHPGPGPIGCPYCIVADARHTPRHSARRGSPVTASDARPPSDTEATGWHRHDTGNVFRDDFCEFHGGPHIPVLVVDPAEARQKVAEALFSMGFEAPWIYVDAVFAALGSQEQP